MTGETIERKLRHLDELTRLLAIGKARHDAGDTTQQPPSECWLCAMMREYESMLSEDEAEKAQR